MMIHAEFFTSILSADFQFDISRGGFHFTFSAVQSFRHINSSTVALRKKNLLCEQTACDFSGTSFHKNLGGIAAVIVWSFYRLSSADAALMAKFNNGEITKEECDLALSRKY